MHDGLDRHATLDVSISWKEPSGAQASVTLRVWPWLSYACTPGSRIKIALPSHEFYGACATVQRVLDDDRCVSTVDVVDRETVVDPRPDSVVRTSRPAYDVGTRLLVLHKHEMRDAVVLDWTGGSDGEEEVQLGVRHRLEFAAVAAPPSTPHATSIDTVGGGDGRGGGDASITGANDGVPNPNPNPNPSPNPNP